MPALGCVPAAAFHQSVRNRIPLGTLVYLLIVAVQCPSRVVYTTNVRVTSHVLFEGCLLLEQEVGEVKYLYLIFRNGRRRLVAVVVFTFMYWVALLTIEHEV